MAYEVDVVANEFLTLAEKEVEQVTPLKLQKLVYYAHAWNLAVYDQPLIRSRIEAWPYGPVIVDLYLEFQEFKDSPITRRATELDSDLNQYIPSLAKTDNRARDLIHHIWGLLKPIDAKVLLEMTNVSDEPWLRIPVKRPGLAIPDELIKKCFKKKLENSRKRA